MNSIRELIIQECMARAGGIRLTSPVTTYQTDIGKTVYRAQSRTTPLSMPCVNIIPQSEEADYRHGRVLNTMAMRIEGLHGYDPETENVSVVSERVLADLISAFLSPYWDRRRPAGTSPETHLPPYAEAIMYRGGGVDDYPDEGQLITGSAIILEVQYYTQTGNPYAQ